MSLTTRKFRFAIGGATIDLELRKDDVLLTRATEPIQLSGIRLSREGMVAEPGASGLGFELPFSDETKADWDRLISALQRAGYPFRTHSIVRDQIALDLWHGLGLIRTEATSRKWLSAITEQRASWREFELEEPMLAEQVPAFAQLRAQTLAAGKTLNPRGRPRGRRSNPLIELARVANEEIGIAQYENRKLTRRAAARSAIDRFPEIASLPKNPTPKDIDDRAETIVTYMKRLSKATEI